MKPGGKGKQPVAHVEAVAVFTAALSGVERVEVLPFHRLGAMKWSELQLPYQLADVLPPSQLLVEQVKTQFRAQGQVVI